MENHELMGINMMEIVVFLKASELESFSQTASYLGITKSMVSKRITALETALGMTLFNRSHNRVGLTAAGKSLAKDWRSLYHSLLFSLEKARRQENRKRQPVVIGLGSSTNSDRYLTPLLSAYEAENQNAAYQVELRSNFDLLEDLLQGRFDVIFLPFFLRNRIAEHSELNSFEVFTYPLLVGMSMDNPLSQQESVSIADLKNCEFILVKLSVGGEYAKLLDNLCATEGFKPIVGSYVENDDSVYLNIVGNKVFVTDRLYRHMQSNTTVYRELVGTESGLLAAWRKDAALDVINFIGYAKKFFEQCG
ncbi:LysR family transcriptional regulator [Eubacteriaceae bacterium ES2]|nr:LysR family transcriptional regulator [Eubacteriaceae bacterium ES2]